MKQQSKRKKGLHILWERDFFFKKKKKRKRNIHIFFFFIWWTTAVSQSKTRRIKREEKEMYDISTHYIFFVLLYNRRVDYERWAKHRHMLFTYTLINSNDTSAHILLLYQDLIPRVCFIFSVFFFLSFFEWVNEREQEKCNRDKHHNIIINIIIIIVVMNITIFFFILFRL